MNALRSILHVAAIALLSVVCGFAGPDARNYLAQVFTVAPSGPNWSPISGSLTGNASGLGSATSGAVIANVGSSTNYEVRTYHKLLSAGGSYVTYLRASADAWLNPLGASQGSFVAVELYNVQFPGGRCLANIRIVNKPAGGGVTETHAGSLWCEQDFQLRMVVRDSFLYVFKDKWDGCCFWADLTAFPTGRPGLGVSQTPFGNGIYEAKLQLLDTTPPPTPQRPGVSAFATRVEMQWPGTGDDADGSGLYLYWIYRRTLPSGAWEPGVGTSLKPNYVDPGVAAGTSYEYLLLASDYSQNVSSSVVFQVTTAPADSTDARRVGVRPDGTYWGGAGEQIDIASGNLNYTIPLVSAQGRGGWSVPVTLHYNSQIWRKDPGGIWHLGRDVGFGHGWRMTPGTVTPVWQDWATPAFYVYRDSSGAEYRLDVPNPGADGEQVWSSKEGVYVEYHRFARRLYFPDGTFWVMDVEAGVLEEDAGTLYPARIQDSNGNWVALRYGPSVGSGTADTSGRLTEIEDVRARQDGARWWTYRFDYVTHAGRPVPHLSAVWDWKSAGTTRQIYAFGLYYDAPLQSPWSPLPTDGTTHFLSTVNRVQESAVTSLFYHQSNELKQVNLPLGATLRWEYRSAEWLGQRFLREVQERFLKSTPAGAEDRHWFWHHDAGDVLRSYHAVAALTGPDGNDKAWWFNALGRLVTLQERDSADVVMAETTYAWSVAPAQPYVTQVDRKTGTVTKRTTQVLDGYGNVTESMSYDYDQQMWPDRPRKWVNTYLNGAEYLSRYIRNRLKTSTMTWQEKNSAEVWVSKSRLLVDNRYDADVTGSSCVSTLAVPVETVRQFDAAGYPTTFHYRGNLRHSVLPGSQWTCQEHDQTGRVRMSKSHAGVTVETPAATGFNNTLPALVKPNGIDSMATSYAWLPNWRQDYEQRPNAGDRTTTEYDDADRPKKVTEATGAVTDYSYVTTPGAAYTKAVHLGGNAGWTKTWLDGLGRTVKVERGYYLNGVEVLSSSVETVYAACACSPMGKVKKVSVPGVANAWTEYFYDALGRTVEVRLPPNTGGGPNAVSAGTTSYVYLNNTVKVIDPKLDWKTYTMDGFGNLVQVEEPNPKSGANLQTTYDYNGAGQLLYVRMTRDNVAQKREFVYDDAGRVKSVKTPETGGLETEYFYKADGTLDYRLDPKGQKVSYVFDGFKRLKEVKRFKNVDGALVQDVCGTLSLGYDEVRSIPVKDGQGNMVSFPLERLVYRQWGGVDCAGGEILEELVYNAAGQPTAKEMTVAKQDGGGGSLRAYWSYDQWGRMVGEGYPAGLNDSPAYGAGGTYQFGRGWDLLGRPKEVEWWAWVREGTQLVTRTKMVVSGATYDAGDRLTAIGGAASMQWGYNNHGQVTRIQAGNQFHEEYEYQPAANDGRVWQTKNVLSGERLQHAYDGLKRLVRTWAVEGAPFGVEFGYDGFGNLESQAPSPSGLAFNLNVDRTRNQVVGWSYDTNGNVVSDGARTLEWDVENRLARVMPSSGVETRYGYDPENLRVYESRGVLQEERYYFYAPDGRLLGVYRPGLKGATRGLDTVEVYVDFGGRTVATGRRSSDLYGVTFWVTATDPVGSVRAGMREASAFATSYYPYGQERTVTDNGTGKFGTYWRDGSTGLDYARQRWYASAQGRFLTPDPSGAADPGNPGSWNQYGYAGGDPVNFNDPSGLDVNVTLSELAPDRCGVAVANQVLARTNYGMSGQGAFNLFNSKEGILGISVFLEVRPNGAYGEDSGWYQSMLGVANLYLNRYYSNWGGSRGRGSEGFKQAIMDASTPIWTRTSRALGNHTSRDLYSRHANTIDRVLRGAADDVAGDCAGLIFSMQFAANVVARHFGIAYHPVPGMNIYNNVGNSLYFHSKGEQIPQGHWDWDGPLDYYKSYWTPHYQGGYRPFHFFTKRGVQVPRPTGL